MECVRACFLRALIFHEKGKVRISHYYKGIKLALVGCIPRGVVGKGVTFPSCIVFRPHQILDIPGQKCASFLIPCYLFSIPLLLRSKQQTKEDSDSWLVFFPLINLIEPYFQYLHCHSGLTEIATDDRGRRLKIAVCYHLYQ